MNKIISLIPIVFILVGTSSCSTTGNRGTIREHHEVTSIFRSFEVIPTYNYYYYGTFLYPDTIMGIDNRYTVVSELWKYIDLTPKQLERWVVNLDRDRGDRYFASRYHFRYQGAYVLDPGGQTIGIWYSKLDWGLFEFPGDKVIIPYAPSLKPSIHDLRLRSFDD